MTRRVLAWASISTLVCAAVAHAQDWPQWRGPGRDGAAAAFRVPAAWPAALTKRWNVEVGPGYATPLVVGARVFVFSRQGEDEVLSALDAASGKVVWRTSYPAPFKMNPATAPHGPGPKSTPAFANGRLFTLGISGIVTAFDAATGRQLWQKQPGPVQPLYHTGMSPVVDGNQVIVHVGGHDNGALTAHDVATGAVRWAWTGDGPAYGSPLVLTLAGSRQVVTFTQRNFVGVSAETGRLLWQRPFTTPSTTTSQTPMLHKDLVIQMGRDNGVTAFRVVAKGDTFATEEAWRVDDVSMHMSDAVAVDGVLFGLSHLNSGQYFALDLDSGKVLWKGPPRQAAHAAIARAGNTILSLEDDHELIVMRASRTGFEPVTRYQVAASDTWPQASYSGNRIFVKDVSSVTLWTVD